MNYQQKNCVNYCANSSPNTPSSLKQKATAFFTYEKDEDYDRRYWTVDFEDCETWLESLTEQGDEILLHGILALWDKADDCIAKNDYIDDDFMDFFDVLAMYLDKLFYYQLPPQNLQSELAMKLDKSLNNKYYIDYLDGFVSDCYNHRVQLWKDELDYLEWLAFLDKKIKQY